MQQRRKVEDYLKTIYVLKMRHGSVRGVDIATMLNVSRPTVSVFLKGLTEKGFVYMDKFHIVYLTPMGLEVAKATYERHKTFKTLLELLGVEKRTAEEDACQMEHAVSPKSYDAFKALSEKLKKNRNEILKGGQKYDD